MSDKYCVPCFDAFSIRFILALLSKPMIRPGRDRFFTGFHSVSRFDTSIFNSSRSSSADVELANLYAPADGLFWRNRSKHG